MSTTFFCEGPRKVNRPVGHPTNVAKTAFEQVECGFMFGPRAPSGPETYNKDKTETGRDSVGRYLNKGLQLQRLGSRLVTYDGLCNRCAPECNGV